MEFGRLSFARKDRPYPINLFLNCAVGCLVLKNSQCA